MAGNHTPYRYDPTKPPKVGPLGRYWWNDEAKCWSFALTEEGEREFEKTLRENPNPVKLLQHSHPAVCQWAKKMLAGHPGALEQAAVTGVWYGLLRWNPARGAKSTSISLWIRNAVQKEVDLSRRGTDAEAWTPDQSRRDDEVSWPNVARKARLVVGRCEECRPAAAVAEERELCRIVREKMVDLTPLQRDAIETYYGFHEPATTWFEMSKANGVRRETMRERAVKGMRKLRKTLAGLEV